MSLFVVALLVSTALCALVTGFVFTYAVVVMPGFSRLSDREFVRAFQVTDQIIQNRHDLPNHIELVQLLLCPSSSYLPPLQSIDLQHTSHLLLFQPLDAHLG